MYRSLNAVMESAIAADHPSLTGELSTTPPVLSPSFGKTAQFRSDTEGGVKLEPFPQLSPKSNGANGGTNSDLAKDSEGEEEEDDDDDKTETGSQGTSADDEPEYNRNCHIEGLGDYDEASYANAFDNQFDEVDRARDALSGKPSVAFPVIPVVPIVATPFNVGVDKTQYISYPSWNPSPQSTATSVYGGGHSGINLSPWADEFSAQNSLPGPPGRPAKTYRGFAAHTNKKSWSFKRNTDSAGYGDAEPTGESGEEAAEHDSASRIEYIEDEKAGLVACGV